MSTVSSLNKLAYKKLSNCQELVSITKDLMKISSNEKRLILVRSCENIGSLSGCLNGWLDAKLSEYGRKQSKYLSVEYFSYFDNKDSFANIYISDLLRAKETADICLGFDYNVNYITCSELREIYFGENEGLFYDGLPKEEKSKINKINYKFKRGEAWMDVKYRGIKFIDEVVHKSLKERESNKIDLAFTHGGFITSLLYTKNIKPQPPNGSVVIVTLKSHLGKNSELDRGKYKSLLNEFSKLYNCADEAYNQSLFEKYNPAFEDYLDKCVKDVNCVFTLPDLTEELL